MPKLKIKISGLFQSENWAIAFSRIRSCISTMQKNDISIIDGIIRAANGEPWIPDYSNNTQYIQESFIQEPVFA